MSASPADTGAATSTATFAASDDRDAATLDQRIAAVMQLDGRITWREIAGILGTSQSTVARRARAMLADGVIRTTAALEPLRCGLGSPVFVQLECSPDRTPEVAEALAGRSDTRLVVIVTGNTDIVAELIVPTRDELARVLVDQLGAIPGVVRTATQSVLRPFKMAFDWSRPLLDGHSIPPPPEYDVHRPVAPVHPDATDRALVAELSVDARRSYHELAEAVGISESAARRRVEELLASGALATVTLVDPPFLGYVIEIFLFLRVELARLEEIAAALVARPEVRMLAATSGQADLIGEVILPSQEDLYRFRTQVLGGLRGIRDAEMAAELRSIKRAYLLQRRSPEGPAVST